MNKWLLLVEDDKDIQQSLLDLLELEGYRAKGAFDGGEALEVLREAEQLPELILLDLMMRGMSGHEFLQVQAADTRLKHLPVVVMSADGAPKSELVQTQASGFLRKPADVEDILGLVERYLGPPAA